MKYRRFGRKKYRVKPQELLRPCEHHFNKLNFSDEEKQMFHEVCRIKNNVLYKHFVFNEPWRFVLRVKPNIIDKVRKDEPELKSKLKQIDSYLERNNYKPRYDKVNYGRVWRYWKRDDQYLDGVNILKHKSLSQVLDAIKQDENKKV